MRNVGFDWPPLNCSTVGSPLNPSTCRRIHPASHAVSNACCAETGRVPMNLSLMTLVYFHQLLAEIFALQQADKSCRRILQAFRHALAVLDAAAGDMPGEFVERDRPARQVIEH